MLADFVSQNLRALEFCLGALIVFLLTIRRFGIPPPQWVGRTAGQNGAIDSILGRIVKGSRNLAPDPDVFRPVSSNTTKWKFYFFGTCYGVVGVVIYWIFLLFPTLAKHTPALLEGFGVPSNFAQLILIPSLLIQAFIIAFVFPSIRPFR